MMAIESEYGHYTPVCDGCLKTLAKCQTFQDALDITKAEGWRSVKVNGVWQNLCPDCYRERRKDTTPKFLEW